MLVKHDKHRSYLRILITAYFLIAITGCTNTTLRADLFNVLTQDDVERLFGEPSKRVSNKRDNIILMYRFEESFEAPLSGYNSPLAPPSRQPTFKLECLLILEIETKKIIKVDTQGRGCNRIQQAINHNLEAFLAAKTTSAAHANPMASTNTLVYLCDSGKSIGATYPSSEQASIQYQGQGLDLQSAVSASGARYVGSGLEWWTKGSGPDSEAILFNHKANGTTGVAIERCVAKRTAP